MPVKIKTPKFKSLNPLIDILKNKQRKLIETNQLAELKQLLSEFANDIPVTIKEEFTDDKYIIAIGVDNENSTEIPNAAGGTTNSVDLFNYLNEGTEIRYAVMPQDYNRESFPNSLRTQRQNNAKHKIFLSNDNQGGIEGRHWLELLDEKYKATMITQVEKNVIDFLSKWSK